MTLTLLTGEAWTDYGLVDCGAGRKLERYGPYRFIRPEPQAMWAPASLKWDAHGEFVPGADEDGGGRWRFDQPVPRGWELGWQDLRFTAQPTPFRHLAFFPDMMSVWGWAADLLRPVEQPAALNLFGYTGVGSLAMAKAGAAVTHVDASRKSVEAAKANAKLSGIDQVRWMVDDAQKFAAREVRRGRHYHGVILDPPKYGRGPDGEVWRLEDDLPRLLADVRRLVDERSAFVFLTVYAVRMSALAIGELMRQLFADLPGQVEAGEIGVREEARGLILPTAIFARWTRG